MDLWTDGSRTTADKPGGWAFVLRLIHPATGDIFESEGSGWEAYGSNNQMELTALLKGLRALKRPSLVCVHSDSKYVIKPFTEGWISRWDDVLARTEARVLLTRDAAIVAELLTRSCPRPPCHSSPRPGEPRALVIKT